MDAKNQVLPLARIKKIMKLDEDVKMISAEAPLLFAKAAEVFIQELTLRAWVHTEDNKRRTLQRNDIAMAITKFDQFDFLIDIVPREEVKPVKKENETKPLVNCDQVQYYLQLAQQHQQALQGTNGITAQQVQQPGTTIQLQGQNVTQPITLAAPQNILVTNTGSPTVVGGLQQGQQTQQIQLVQQIVTPNGEITHVPVSFKRSTFDWISFIDSVIYACRSTYLKISSTYFECKFKIKLPSLSYCKRHRYKASKYCRLVSQRHQRVCL